MNLISLLLIGFVALAFILAVFVFVKSSRRKFSDKDRRFIIVKWEEIFSISKSDFKNAIIEADKLLDYTLSKKGYSGSLGDKLKKAAPLFTDLNGIWGAHKIRNRLAHEMGFEVSPDETQDVLSQFKRALRDLGVKF